MKNGKITLTRIQTLYRGVEDEYSIRRERERMSQKITILRRNYVVILVGEEIVRTYHELNNESTMRERRIIPIPREVIVPDRPLPNHRCSWCGSWVNPDEVHIDRDSNVIFCNEACEREYTESGE